MEVELNVTHKFFQTRNWLGNIYRSMANFWIISFVETNHNRDYNLAQRVLPMRGERTILEAWFVWIKGTTIVSKNNVGKYERKC